jgi:hypothetical protein
MKKLEYIVYELVDPITNLVRYVGKSSLGIARARAHLTPCLYNGKATKHLRVYKWIRSLIKKNNVPIIKIYAYCTSEEHSSLVEIERIYELKKQGMNLCNGTDGGEGARGRKRSAEHTERLRKLSAGRPMPDHVRQNLNKLRKGMKFSQEWKNNISKSLSRKIVRSDGVVFNSHKEAAEALNVVSSTVRRAMDGKIKKNGELVTCKGFTFTRIDPKRY